MLQYQLVFDKLHQLFKIPYVMNCRKYGDWSDRDRPILILIHGIGFSLETWKPLIKKLPEQPILAVDLLGFGNSKKPNWLDYNLDDQVTSLKKTIRWHLSGRPFILCGHSLGSLVTTRYASQQPKYLRNLILCSPPIYDLENSGQFPTREAFLEQIGRRFLSAIQSSPMLIQLINDYVVKQDSPYIDPDDTSPYVKTAHNSIIGQNSLRDIKRVNVPIDLIYGRFDGVMIPKNFQTIKKFQPNTKIHAINVGHTLTDPYMTKIAEVIKNIKT